MKYNSLHEFTLKFSVNAEGTEPTMTEVLQGILDKLKQITADKSQVPAYVDRTASFDVLYYPGGRTVAVQRDSTYDGNVRDEVNLPF